jgi:hypothetical protein
MCCSTPADIPGCTANLRIISGAGRQPLSATCAFAHIT